MNTAELDRVVTELGNYPTEIENGEYKVINTEILKLEGLYNFAYQTKQLEILQCICETLEKIQTQYVSGRNLKKV